MNVYLGYVAHVPGGRLQRFLEQQFPGPIGEILQRQWEYTRECNQTTITLKGGAPVITATMRHEPRAVAAIAVFYPHGLKERSFATDETQCRLHGADECLEITNPTGSVRQLLNMYVEH